MIDEKAFKAYDIRGLCPESVNEELAYVVGKAFVTHLNCKTVVVGMDMRPSSKKLFTELARGINEMGADVINIGMVTTPVLNFAVAKYGFDGGIMISASHNPGKYNAFKLIEPPALQIGATCGMQEIKELALKNDFKESDTKGNISEKDVLQDYLDHVMRYAKNIKGLKVVLDYGNGVGAISAKPLLDKLPITCVHMYDEPDGTFPNHEANPHELDNFKDLQKKVKEEGADIGIFFDGDADRSAIVDSDGDIVFPDIIFGTIVQHCLKNYDDKRVYYDLRFTKAIKEMIVEHEGNPIMMRVGNPFYKEKLIKDGGAMGCELSGHMMFSDNFCIDDGLFAAIMLLDVMCKTGKPLSELITPMKRYHGSPEINTKVTDADVVMEEARAMFPDGDSIEIDGVYISYPDWWFNLRKSNTEPLVRLRVEAKTEEMLDEKLNILLELIEKHKA